MVEEARLESVYTPKGYRGFESLGLRIVTYEKAANTPGFGTFFQDLIYTHHRELGSNNL